MTNKCPKYRGQDVFNASLNNVLYLAFFLSIYYKIFKNWNNNEYEYN